MTRAAGFLGFATHLSPRGSDVASLACIALPKLTPSHRPTSSLFCLCHAEDLLANDTVTDVAFVGPGEVQTPNHHAVFFDIS